MNLNLSNLPGAFGSGPVPDMDDRDVSKVRVDLLDPFPHHPYSVNDDQAMDELVESVRMLGVVAPLLLRPVDGRYQIISGHRRAHAARLAGLEEVPAVIRDMDDDTATITMVDSNKSRPSIPLSEQAKAMRMRHDAILHQGSMNDDGRTTREQLGDENDMSEKSAARLVQLGHLHESLMPHLDNGSLPARSGLQIVRTKPDTQQNVAAWLDSDPKRKLAEKQAKTIRALDEQQHEPLDAGTIATVAPAPATKPKDEDDWIRIPAAWIPTGMERERAVEWIHSLLDQYDKENNTQ